MKTMLFFLGAAAVLGGCSYAARSPEMYQKDTAELLASRNPNIKSCYDQQLAGGTPVTGTVAVAFTVKGESGTVQGAKVLPDQTTAPEAVGSCVVSSLEGLQLDPPDARDGQATYSWNFTAQ